jgi:hypothetical protein
MKNVNFMSEVKLETGATPAEAEGTRTPLLEEENKNSDKPLNNNDVNGIDVEKDISIIDWFKSLFGIDIKDNKNQLKGKVERYTGENKEGFHEKEMDGLMGFFRDQGMDIGGIKDKEQLFALVDKFESEHKGEIDKALGKDSPFNFPEYKEYKLTHPGVLEAPNTRSSDTPTPEMVVPTASPKETTSPTTPPKEITSPTAPPKEPNNAPATPVAPVTQTQALQSTLKTLTTPPSNTTPPTKIAPPKKIETKTI